MNFLKGLRATLRILLNARITFAKPQHKKIVIFDKDLSDFVTKYLDKKNVSILDIRFRYNKGENLNLYILLKMLLSFKFSSSDYFKIYLNIVKPKLLLTLIDNTTTFWKLKSFYPKAKTMIIQNAFRGMVKFDVLANIETYKKNKNYMCDYILTYNKVVGDKYKSFLKGEVVPIGSFRSNSVKINNESKIYDLLFVSMFKKNHSGYQEMLGNFIKLFNNIKKYSKEKNYKLNILGSKTTEIEEEKAFYKDIFSNLEFNFIPQAKNRKTYEIVDKAKILISIDSSLGYESAIRGNKVAFIAINNRADDLEGSYRFGWPENKDRKGSFWTDNTSYDEFFRVMNFLDTVDHQDYLSLINKELQNLIEYNSQNSKFISILNKLQLS